VIFPPLASYLLLLINMDTVLVAEATYPVTMGLLRISMLLFFLRIFPDEKFRLLVKILIGYMAVHSLIFFFLVIFQCHPVRYSWDKTIDGTCIDINATTYAGAAIVVVHDVMLLSLPLWQLRSLQLNIMKKTAAILMFIFGSW